MKKSNEKVIYSKITSKYQVTIPHTVREFLKVGVNDKIKWTIKLEKNGEIIISVAHPGLWDIIRSQQERLGSIDVSEFDWED